MALSGKLSIEVTVQTPAAKYFNIFITQSHKFQNICERIHEAKLHEGDNWHVPHSVKNWTLIVDGKPIKFKGKIEAIDKENKSITYNLFDGDISKNYKVFKLFLQVFEKSDGGASAKFTIEYEKINENVEAPYGFMELFDKNAKEFDSHLLKA
ncbi:hypothetical protein HN51_049833 [Arachis hypogaea]|uniref:MLP-like protein 43 n=1 Tax=Arachis ipaensis TaxID=130454 RepID=UPI0007AF1553|nr:MLP-like protein 43 [Arachis ipaensis]XP_025667216.1 MLP-like protein 43 [Arachis hypogaea]